MIISFDKAKNIAVIKILNRFPIQLIFSIIKKNKANLLYSLKFLLGKVKNKVFQINGTF